MLILFTEIFTVTFINDCAVTTIFTISLLRLRVCQPFISLPPTTEEVNAIARDVCLSVSKITHKRVYGFR